MPLNTDLQKGEVFIDQQRLTPHRLNNLFDAATILPTFITNKTEDTTPDWAADFVVTYDASGHRLRKVRGSAFFGYYVVANPAFITLTVGGITEYPVSPVKASQNAQVTLTQNTRLFITPLQYGNGMQGSLLVIQDGTGGRTLTAMQTGHNTIWNMIPGQPPSNGPVLLPIGTQGNERTMLNWTFLPPIFSWTAVKYGP